MRAIRIMILISVCLAISTYAKNVPMLRFYYLQIDETFTPEERLSIEKAAQRWEKATNGSIRFTTEVAPALNYNPVFEILRNTENKNSDIELSARTIYIWNAKPEDIRLQIFEALAGIQIFGYSHDDFIIMVPERMDTLAEVEKTAAHEIGHSLGLGHTRSLMSWDATSQCITSIDTKQFCQIYGCRNYLDTSPECL